MNIIEKSVEVGGTTYTFQTGKIAKQASGSILVTAGGTSVLVTAQASKDTKPGINFLPLTVDYQEKMAAAGRIPGGFFKREGKPRDIETLTSRMIDRSIRPLFADGWGFETQVIASVYSADPAHPGDTLAMTGASMALGLSDIAFTGGPIAGIRILRVDGKYLINPAFELRETAEIDLFVSCSRDAIVMVEGGGDEVSEADMIDALLMAHKEAQKLIDIQHEMIKAAGKEKREPEVKVIDADLTAKVTKLAMDGIKAGYAIDDKLPRYAALDAAKSELKAALLAEDEAYADQMGDVSTIISKLKYDYVRGNIIKEGKRIGGRGLTDIRKITTETGILPRTHGSALFTRGETQALVVTTLGTRQDEQRVDDLYGESFRGFMLHYSFPPFSVGEVKFLRGPGRREIGHGSLAERALLRLVQKGEDFPYTIRITSEIMESNGSSSMATVCGGSMSMMAAGVPMKDACAGIAMGLIQEGDDIAILSDILGDEDHLGDMDFKIAGSHKGITAIQMDIKIEGVDRKVLEDALEQARVGRLHILDEMAKTVEKTSETMSDFAPRITTIRIKQDRIRDIIGPGGKTIKDIVARTGCQINVEDDGLVSIASTDGESAAMALKIVKDLTQEAELNKIYLGNVRKIMDFGAFVEIFPGTDGLIHISELADKRVKRVEDVLQEGDEVLVKVIGFDRGKIKLSRKAALSDEAEANTES